MSYLFVGCSFLISMLLAMLVIPKILVIAAEHSLYDIPNKRKTHIGPIPRIGGVSFIPCILISIMFVFGIFYMFANKLGLNYYYPDISELCFFICGLLLLYLGGVKDDLVGMRYSYKFIIQVAISLLIVFSGLYINNFYGILNIYEISPWIGMPLTVVLFVFIINAMNLIDGMDGLASGISIFALCVYGTLFLLHGLWYYSALAFSTIGVLVPFFYYNVFGNVNKGRKLFMGDSGSLTLGLILGFLAIRYAHYNPIFIIPIENTLIIAFSPILIPMLDVTRVILSRAKNHKHLFKADRCHIHHKLMDMGLNHYAALAILLLISSGFCMINFILIRFWGSLLIITVDITLWVSINMYFSYIIKERKGLKKEKDAEMIMKLKKVPLKQALTIATILFTVSSCAVLTKSQLKMVTNLTVASDSVAVAPRVIFDELATVRLERGLFYAASLTSAEAREKEINALAVASIADEQLVNRADVYINVLNSYLRSLRSISADARWTSEGTEWRGIGRNIDSLIIRFNQTELANVEIPVGWAKLSGQYAGYMSENYARSRQAKTVKEFVAEGDTLVKACVDGLIELLRKGEMEDLIENESEGLKSNYEAYLHRVESSGLIPDISIDRDYIVLVKRVDKAKKTRSRCVTALQSLKRAHGKLVVELEKRKKTDYIFEELLELNTLALNLQTMLK